MSNGPAPGAGPEKPYAGRAALKLRHALDEFHLVVTGVRCADFGCNVGGFTDCLLRAGAAHVHALDTGYGMLAWTLRNDPRVTAMERTNALHAPRPPVASIGLVAIDMGWTPQRLCIPAALRWLAPGAPPGRIITLIKPHYEASDRGRKDLLRDGVLGAEDARRMLEQTLAAMPALGAEVLGVTESPLLGGAGKKNSRGNAEFLALLKARSS